MALYQRKVLATGELVGEPAPLPLDLQGTLTDADLEHLSDFGPAEHYSGQGFFRVPDPSPPSPRWLHKAVWIQRMDAAKRIAIRDAAKTDPVIEDFMYVLSQAENVDLDAQNMVAGVAYLVAQNLLSAEEAETLLS